MGIMGPTVTLSLTYKMECDIRQTSRNECWMLAGWQFLTAYYNHVCILMWYVLHLMDALWMLAVL